MNRNEKISGSVSWQEVTFRLERHKQFFKIAKDHYEKAKKSKGHSIIGSASRQDGGSCKVEFDKEWENILTISVVFSALTIEAIINELKLNPDDIGLYCELIGAYMQNQKKAEEQGVLAELFFLTGLILGQKQPELVQEAKNYVKDTMRKTLDEIVESTKKMLLDITEKYKEKLSDSD